MTARGPRPPAPPIEGLSRRQLLTGGALAVGALGLEGCATPGWDHLDPGDSEPAISFWLRRAEDQLELRYTFFNARFANLFYRPLALERRDPSRPLIVRVGFNEQHVHERAFKEEALNPDPPTEPPVDAVLSGATRLVFEIDGLRHGRFQLTWENLLDWSAWRARLVPETRPIAAIQAPGLLQTAIELPTRLQLSPAPTNRWAFAPEPSSHNGRIELWHAALQGRTPDEPASVRAVWTPDFDPATPPPTFTASLNARDRKDLVLVTHAQEHAPEAINPKTLLLTAAGGWLDLEKAFEIRQEHTGLVTSWKHRATRGRDQFVEVERAAVLYPFGFFVSVIKTTERKAERSPSGHRVGYLRQKLTIKFNELARDYGAWDMPFARLEPTIIETPPIDTPVDLFDGGDWEDGVFWPRIAGAPFEFRFTATDHDGAAQTFTAPLICIMDQLEPRATLMRNAAAAEYSAAGNSPLRTRPFAAQSVAVSPSGQVGRTAVLMESLEFEGRSGSRVELPVRNFEPRARRMKAALGAISGNMAGPAGRTAWFEPYDPQAVDNENQVFLLAEPGAARLDLGFAGNTRGSGGFLSPTLSVAGVSRLTGPFGGQTAPLVAGPDPFATGRFSPASFFPPGATILGGVEVSDILNGVVGAAAGGRVPAVLSELIEHTESPPYVSHALEWLTDDLRSSPKFGDLEPVFLISADAGSAVPDPGVPTTLSLHAEAVVPLYDPEGGYAELDASITNFCIQLVAFGNGVQLKIRSVSFSAPSSGKTEFNLDLEGYELVGPLLSFVKLLQDYLGIFGDDSPIDISPSGVAITLPSLNLPPILLGGFNIENVRIISGVWLPFDGSPIELSFALSSRIDPFAVTVGVFGGVGHFLLVIDTLGVKLVDASFAFGAYKEINVGPLRGRGYILGGLTYSSKRIASSAPNGPPFVTKIDYSAFVQVGGSGTVLGFLSVAIDYHVGLYIEQVGSASRMYGRCTVTYSYSIGFFSSSVSVTYEKEFEGSGGNGGGGGFAALGKRTACAGTPTMSREQWRTYRAAFARAA